MSSHPRSPELLNAWEAFRAHTMILSTQYGGEVCWWTSMCLHKKDMYVAICITCNACTPCQHVLSECLCSA